MSCTVGQTTIPMADGTSIDALVYKPLATESPLAVAVFAHGGCFGKGDCTSHKEMSTAMANAGLLVVDSSYRQGNANPQPAATNDLGDVTRWTRKCWPELQVGVVGSSSGGWFAMAMAASPPGLLLYSRSLFAQ